MALFTQDGAAFTGPVAMLPKNTIQPDFVKFFERICMLRLLVASLLLAHTALAADKKLGLENQSELGYVVTGGNSEAETTSFKQLSTYKVTGSVYTFTGHYLQSSGQVADTANPGETINQTTAENWSAKLRYDKVITEKWFNVFLSHGWRGDRFQGVSSGHDTDLGGKYYTANSKSYQQFFELGYRYTRELFTVPSANCGATTVGTGNCAYPEFHYVRLFGKADYVHSKSFSMGIWVEYLPSVVNFSKDQRINFSPYITSVLTDMFSLKVAYLSRYRHERAAGATENTDYTFTTSLIAKF